LNTDGEYKDFDDVYGNDTNDLDRPSLKAKLPTSERDVQFRKILVGGMI
jgi:hypothetical protein